MKRRLLSIVVLLMVARTALPAECPDTACADIPLGKQTVLGHYITAKEAYQKCKSDPRQVKLLDIRTPENIYSWATRRMP